MTAAYGNTVTIALLICRVSHLTFVYCIEQHGGKVVDPLIFEGLTPPPESRIVCVDNSENDTLTAAVGRAKLCLNCTGPYRFLGEAVVSACVEAG